MPVSCATKSASNDVELTRRNCRESKTAQSDDGLASLLSFCLAPYVRHKLCRLREMLPTNHDIGAVRGRDESVACSAACRMGRFASMWPALPDTSSEIERDAEEWSQRCGLPPRGNMGDDREA